MLTQVLFEKGFLFDLLLNMSINMLIQWIPEHSP